MKVEFLNILNILKQFFTSNNMEGQTYFQVSKEEGVEDFSAPKLAKQDQSSINFPALYVQCLEICKFSTRSYV